VAYGSGHLWVVGTAGYADTGLQVAPGSSPSVAGLAGGGYEVAFQAFVAPRPAPAPAPAAGTTSIPVPSPSPAARRRHHLRVRIVFRWRRSGSHTKLLSLRFVHLARHARIRIACHGRHCPRRLASASRAGGRAVGRWDERCAGACSPAARCCC